MFCDKYFRKAVSALSGPFPPLKGNVVASAANSGLLNYICAAPLPELNRTK